ncbi:hypothetical protein [Pseudomonas chlororaphis]|uniref:hypothetical protein n=1 Tax=Pseudomonas chlororaphis TaxID=587753 RepID=UPI0024077F50|nr:hypothetical protein [Pseudomonas chlororaphis]
MPTENQIKRYTVAGLVQSSENPTMQFVTVVDFNRVAAERDALQADLDAKDQRVDELEGVLREAWSYAQHPQNVVATPSELGKRIAASLNPTPKPHTCCGSCPAGCIGAKP